MYTCGIDVGSVSAEAVILNRQDGKTDIAAYIITPTGGDSKEAATNVFNLALEKSGLAAGDISAVVATGYGRLNIPFATKNITEISCHARGVVHYFPDIKTVIDIGGQDSKVIKLDSKGNPIDFLMNDKCAAGTGTVS